VQIDVAADLNEAFAADKPIEQLMRTHRLLALSQARLPQRIGVMRKIAQLDGENPVWDQDIREFEKARHHQIASELKIAVGSLDQATLFRLLEEFASNDWREPPPQLLVKQTQQGFDRVRQHHARKGLKELEQRITAAFSELDVIAAALAKAQWDELAPIGLKGADDRLLEVVAPAFEWLEGELSQQETRRDYERCISELEQALDQEAGDQELDRLYYSLSTFEWGVPPHLERRMRERLESLRFARIRRTRLVAATAVTTILCAGAVIILLIRQQHRESSVAGNVAVIKPLVERGDFDKAQERFDQLEADDHSLWSQPKIQELVELLRTQRQTQEQLADDFDRQLNGVLKLIDSIPKGVEADGESEEFNQVVTRGFDAANQASGVLDRVTQGSQKILSRAKRSNVEATSQQFQIDVTTKKNALQDAVDQRFKRRLAGWSDQLAAADDLSDMRRLLQDGSELYNSPYVSPYPKNELSAQLVHLKAQIDQKRGEAREDEAIRQIALGIGDLQSFKDRLEAYATQYPSTPLADDVGNVLKMLPLWQAHEDWSGLAKEWSATDFRASTSDDARKHLKQLSAFTAMHERFPQAKRIEQLKSSLQAIASRAVGNQRLQKQLKDFLESPAFTKLVYLNVEKNGRPGEYYKYYSDRVPRAAGALVSIEYFIDADLTNRGRKSFRHTEVRNPRANNGQVGQYDWTTPQTHFSRFALEKLSELQDRNWEQTFVLMVNRLFQPTKNEIPMDPILRVRTLQEVLDIGGKGSIPMQQAFAEHSRQMDGTKLDFRAWVTPNDEETEDASGNAIGGIAEQERRMATDLITRLSRLYDAPHKQRTLSTLKEALAELNRPSFGPPYTWTAWLRRDRKGSWQCDFQSADNQQILQDLYLLEEVGTDQVRYTRIGKVEDGKVVINVDSGTLEGQPVYSVYSKPTVSSIRVPPTGSRSQYSRTAHNETLQRVSQLHRW
jgi:hypothetical protein